jgi:acyl-CoA thioesterase
MTAVHPDTFAALLGISLTRIGDGRTEATLTVGAHHLNPHATAHGAVIYSIGGVAMAAAANDEEHSGIVTAVHIDYLRPARMGDHLVARAELAERLDREDLFVVRVTKGDQQELVARLSGRATRRTRAARNG